MKELLLVVFYSLLFILIISKISFFELKDIKRFWIVSAFILKIITSYLLFLVYTHYYPDRSTADIFKYFDDSKIMFDALLNKPVDFIRMITGFGNDSPYFDQYYHKMNNWCGVYPSNVYGDGHLLIRFNAIFRIFSLGYYTVHAVFMSFISFIGLIGLFKVFSKSLQDKRQELFFLLFFFPSILFWTSGVLKEGLLFFAIGMIIYIIDSMLDTRITLMPVLILLFSFLLLRYTKFYLFILLLPLCIANIWSRKSKGNLLWIKYLSVLAIFLAIGFVLGNIFPVYDIIHILARKQHDFLQLAKESGAGSLVTTVPLTESYWGILNSIIPGVFKAISMPFPWDIKNIMMVMPALENIFFSLALIVALIFFKKPDDGSLFWFSLLFLLMVLSLTGMISPVIGAMVRYRTIAIPFYISALLLIWNKEKTLKFLLRD